MRASQGSQILIGAIALVGCVAGALRASAAEVIAILRAPDEIRLGLALDSDEVVTRVSFEIDVVDASVVGVTSRGPFELFTWSEASLEVVGAPQQRLVGEFSASGTSVAGQLSLIGLLGEDFGPPAGLRTLEMSGPWLTGPRFLPRGRLVLTSLECEGAPIRCGGELPRRILVGYADSLDDVDFDRVPDGVDLCIDVYDRRQLDRDGDLVGDACNDVRDADGDEFADALDTCPQIPDPEQADADGDGIGDACDPTPADYAPRAGIERIEGLLGFAAGETPLFTPPIEGEAADFLTLSGVHPGGVLRVGWSPSVHSASAQMSVELAPETRAPKAVGRILRALLSYPFAQFEAFELIGSSIVTGHFPSVYIATVNGGLRTSHPPGDVNRDGRTDGADERVVLAAQGTDFPNRRLRAADLDRDGDVDEVDLELVRRAAEAVHSGRAPLPFFRNSQR